MSLVELKATGIGPIDPLEIRFGERLNLITGDNGLGKSLILDLAFWQLTGHWPSSSALLPLQSSVAEIEARFPSERYVRDYFDAKAQRWKHSSGRRSHDSLVIQFRADGSCSVWDPARNLKTSEHYKTEFPHPFQFDRRQLFDGLSDESTGKPLCNGLIADWVTWELEKSPQFEDFRRVVEILSPIDEAIRLSGFGRIGEDPRRFPMLTTLAGRIPVHLASEAVRRIVGIAYAIAWTWSEHHQAARLRNWTSPNRSIVVLVDEIEAHLHPKWQRTVLPSLLSAVASSGAGMVQAQIIGVTHGPLVLASVETLFDQARDRLFTVEPLAQRHLHQASIQEHQFRRTGDASSWLTSEVFDLPSAYSLEAEGAREAAKAVLRLAEPTAARYQEADQRLRETLSERDPFWARWRYFGEQRKLLPVDEMTSEHSNDSGSVGA